MISLRVHGRPLALRKASIRVSVVSGAFGDVGPGTRVESRGVLDGLMGALDACGRFRPTMRVFSYSCSLFDLSRPSPLAKASPGETACRGGMPRLSSR